MTNIYMAKHIQPFFSLWHGELQFGPIVLIFPRFVPFFYGFGFKYRTSFLLYFSHWTLRGERDDG
jgi:hypothetical protein